MKYIVFLSVSLSLVLLAGCSGATSSPDAGSAPDTSTGDLDAGVDAALVEDGGHADVGVRLDAGTDAAAPVDAAPGVDADVARCDYVGVDEVIVQCDGLYTFVSHFTSEVAGCPEFYGFTPDGVHADSFDEAIASDATCNPDCQWRFRTAVDRLYCGHRTGYEVLEADGCDDVYRFPEGYYPSVEAHDAMNPCP
jgi:hypothetical protein